MKYRHVNIVAEVGLNHSGDIEKAKRLIRIAGVAGCDYVKFQKREPDICVPEEKKLELKTVPWREGKTTYLQYKKDMEFSKEQYLELAEEAEKYNMELFASVWDIPSAEFMEDITGICKIPSAMITDIPLLEYCDKAFSYKIMSTGMSTQEEIQIAIDKLEPQVVMHTNSVYPTPVKDLNLGYINYLQKMYPDQFDVGFSSHYYGIVPCFAAVAMGASWIEVHVCEDHSDWGSDQSSSVEPAGLFKLVKGIRDLELALSKGNEERTLYPGEEKKRKDLRK